MDDTKVKNTYGNDRRVAIGGYKKTAESSGEGNNMTCVSDENGFYGATSDITVNLLYRYELQYEASSSFAYLTPLLERAFTDSMLPELFSDACSDNVFSINGRYLDEEQSAVLGISGNPVDEVIENEPCTMQVTGNNTCVVVAGFETVYLKEENAIISSSIEDLFRISLVNNMNHGSFLSTQSSIVSLRYISLSPDGLVSENGNSKSNNGFLNDVSTPIWFVVGGLAFLSMILVVVVIRVVRNRNYEDDSDEEDSDDEYYDDEEEGEEEDSDMETESGAYNMNVVGGGRHEA
mmetsp:Transcript_25947/g.39850  ORF Transcript_25947/g.39850 Transcript_25947/m.39850 type:complete len:292 (-) Transcript_25947:229-1104(-)